MKPEQAEMIGLQAVTWMIGNDELRDVFLGASGLAEEDLRDGLGDPTFLGSVLEFICQDDAWVIGFSDANGLAYTDPMTARNALPGGELVHWT